MEEARALVEGFATQTGRRPRVLVAELSDDNDSRPQGIAAQDLGEADPFQKIVATGFADLGFDVDVGPRCQLPERAAMQAIDADVHVVVLVTAEGAVATEIAELREVLSSGGALDIMVVATDLVAQESGAVIDAVFNLDEPIAPLVAALMPELSIRFA
jgi:methylmalonyl-CoA mutase